MPAEGGTPRQITRGDYPHGGVFGQSTPRWTPDVVVAAFAVLVERGQTREQDMHVTVERDQKGERPRQIPKGANVATRTNTVESTRTITYVDGKKVEDSYQEKRR